ncbi:MAG TPA: hypothetical protein VGS07_22975 [Thermoanaerobaculia bacterium]|jgi:hypothetical protein|nr:hypothetical protein [Thermoanaerobaculia bacterium]
MRVKWKWRLTGLAVAGLLVGLAAAPGLLSGEVFSIPISDRLLEGQISMPDKAEFPSIRFAAREGTMVTVTDSVTGRIEGWIPILDGTGKPTLTPFQIVPYGNGEKAKQVGPAIPVRLGSFEDFKIFDEVFRVEAQNVQLGSFPNLRLINPRGVSPDKLQKLYGKTGGGNCCVSCGSITVCATAVDLDCGSCSTIGHSPRVY